MRAPSLLDPQDPREIPPPRPDTYDQVRRTLDDALAELELSTRIEPILPRTRKN